MTNVQLIVLVTVLATWSVTGVFYYLTAVLSDGWDKMKRYQKIRITLVSGPLICIAVVIVEILDSFFPVLTKK